MAKRTLRDAIEFAVILAVALAIGGVVFAIFFRHS